MFPLVFQLFLVVFHRNGKLEKRAKERQSEKKTKSH